MTTLTNKLKRVFSIGVIGTGGFLTSLLIGYCVKPTEYKTDCEFYRGYRNTREGKELVARNYAFDSLKLNERRSGQAEYSLEGDISLANQLEIDKRYCFRFEEPKWPWSQRKIVSIRPDTSAISENNIRE